MIKTKLTRGPFNVKGAGGIIIVKVLDHETFIGLPGTQQNCKNIFCQISIFFSKNNLLLYGLVPEFTPEIPSALNQRVHDLFRFNLGISRQIQLQKVRTLRKYFSIGTKKNQTKNVILGDAGHYRPRDQRLPPCAGGLHQLQGFFIH